jgi:rare lipoprotein A
LALPGRRVRLDLRRQIVGFLTILILLIVVLFLSSCGHPKQARVNVPPPPAAVTEAAEPPEGAGSASLPPTHLPPTHAPPTHAPPTHAPPTKEKSLPEGSDENADLAEPLIPPGTKPIASETGLASWYGPPYHNRRGSNGEVYNMHAMTAAHRTYPLGSIVRVTNLTTGHSALVRITDRGPFIPGRVLDLSLAAAHKIDVWQPGVAEVKVELMQTPAVADSGGKWAVQIGGFPDESAANRLADRLTRRYHTAKVVRFASPAGDWWIRVRVLDDDHARAEKLAAETTTSEGAVFVVRLD